MSWCVSKEVCERDTHVIKTPSQTVLGEAETISGVLIVPGNAHALATTAGSSLDHHRVPDLLRNLHGMIAIL